MATINILQQVITYNESNLGLLLNSFCFISTANKKYMRFNDDVPKNLGDTVSFDLPPRFTTTDSLVVSFQSANQRVQTLQVSQQASTAYEFTAQQFIFNVRDYIEKFGRAAISQLGTKVESDVAGLCETAPYRFYGDGVTPIASYGQLANALAFYRNFGSVKTQTKGYISDITTPLIVNSGLNQFALDRNNKEAMSWELGRFSNADWYESNLLPVHTAGTEGNQASVLTVVSTTLDSNGAVITITFSGTHAATDAASVLQYDSFQFSDGVAGYTNLRFLTFIGQIVSSSPVQFQATATAASTGGSQVTVSITPPLQATSGATQNINTPIVAGMQVTVLPTHRCGLITAGDPLFLAMPKLPEEVPFPTSVAQDPDSGASIRMYYGSLFGQNQRGIVHDCIWGKTLPAEYSMKIALPV